MLATDIVSQFEALMERLNQLSCHIDTVLYDKPAWLGGEKITDKSFIKSVFKEFSFDSSIGQCTLSCPGALAGTLETLEIIKQVNQQKLDFRISVDFYLKARGLSGTAAIHDLLRQAGYSAIRLRQVYRTIHGISFHPRRISFTQTRHNSHRVITRSEAEERLMKIGQGANIDWQKERLQLIDDKTLVIQHVIKPIWAVNISTFKQEDGRATHQKLLTRLPIVYLQDANLPEPLVGFSRKYQRQSDRSRKDKAIEATPLLPSLCAYRYKS
ncbi:hypothetical protein [Legionella quinlivanii]|uniref:hypothetical protein n=1 Tax=Legionella quinlivanii TaxID=45073 RepID=UPI0022437696|nr:hypothetical protein [Legionella quinlivanii]MCW8452595.1 hypothetical protein [Legionella quinlivanii]